MDGKKFKNYFNLQQVFYDGTTFTQTAHNKRYWHPNWFDQLRFILAKLEVNMVKLKYAALYTTQYPDNDPRHRLLEIQDSRVVYENPFFKEVLHKANQKAQPKIQFMPYRVSSTYRVVEK